MWQWQERWCQSHTTAEWLEILKIMVSWSMWKMMSKLQNNHNIWRYLEILVPFQAVQVMCCRRCFLPYNKHKHIEDLEAAMKWGPTIRRDILSLWKTCNRRPWVPHLISTHTPAESLPWRHSCWVGFGIHWISYTLHIHTRYVSNSLPFLPRHLNWSFKSRSETLLLEDKTIWINLVEVFGSKEFSNRRRA